MFVEDPTSKGGNMSDENGKVVRDLYAAFGQGDVPTVLAAFAEDIEWHEAEGMPYGGVHRGGEAILQNVFAPIGEDVDGFTVTPEETIAADGTVAAVVRYSGMGKVSGKPLDLAAVHVWDLEGGKVKRFRQFVDTVKFAEVVPAADSVA